MYTRHFGLTVEPFSLTPDPDFLYLSSGHAEALAAIKVGLLGKRGLMVMTGEVGTGKTTLLYALLAALGNDLRTAYVSNTALGFDGILRLALADFGVTPASHERVDMLTALNQLLRDCAERGLTATLIVDEAQNLDAEAFEQLRLLSNFETFTHKLLQLVLVGQPELETRLRQPALRALAERVAVHCRLAPLSDRESRAYLDYRLLRAGGSTRLFEGDARDVLLAATEGLPRRINILCHNALLFAYGRGAKRVSLAVAQLAVAERSALLQGGAAALEPARIVSAPQPRRLPLAALALGVVVLLALALAVLRTTAWFSKPGEASAPGATAFEAAAMAPFPAQAEAAGAGATEPAAAVADAPPESIGPPAAAAGAPAGDERLASAAPQPAPAGAEAAAAVTETAVGSAARQEEPPVEGLALAPATAPAPPADALSLRTVRVKRGSTLGSLAREVYGNVDAALIRRIQSVNPQVVDPNLIIAGDLLHFPEDGPGRPAAWKDESQ